MNPLTLVKKLSALFALLSFAFVLALGLSAGLLWDLVLLRGILVFLGVLLGGLLVFGLAARDKGPDHADVTPKAGKAVGSSDSGS